MPTKLIVHLVCLLCLFILLNAGVKWVVIPELISSQTEKQKKYQEDLGIVLMEMPLLGDYINSLHKNIEKGVKSKLDKKSKIYAIEQQFKDQFQYFFQKQILSNSQILIKKESDIPEKASLVIAPKKTSDFNTLEADKNKITKKDPTPTYFKELSEQLSATQVESILNTFQDHIKKLNPIFTKMDIEVLQYDKIIPEAILDNTNYLTDFHYQLKENTEIHLAFLNLENAATPLPNLGAIRGIKSFYHADITNQKATSLLTQSNLPAIDWKSIKTQFPGEKGHRNILHSDNTDVIQVWQWQQPGMLTVLELFWPTSKNYFAGSILYDFVLLFFLILMGVWFYFYHESHKKEKDSIILPDEIANLKKENKKLEKLLIDMTENNHKKTIPDVKPEIKNTEKIFHDDSKKSYLLPKEQTYLDSKIDFQKDTRDILMEESRTDLLKSLIKKIREGK